MRLDIDDTEFARATILIPSQDYLQPDLHASFCTLVPFIQSEPWTWNMVVFLMPVAVDRGLWPLFDTDDGLPMLPPWLQVFLAGIPKPPFWGLGSKPLRQNCDSNRSTASITVEGIGQTWPCYFVVGERYATVDNAAMFYAIFAGASVFDPT